MDDTTRTRRTPLMDQMIVGVRDHARTYVDYGWDEVVEAWEDADLIAAIGYCRSVPSAIERVAKALDDRRSYAWDVRASSGEYDDPKPGPVARPGFVIPQADDEAEPPVGGGFTMSAATEEAWRNDEVLAAEGKPEQAALARARREREAFAERFGTDGVQAARMAGPDADLDETPLTLEEEEAVAEEARAAKPKRARAPRKAAASRRPRRGRGAELPDPEVALATIKSDPNCTWPGHQAALDEHGFCSVCQH